MNYRDTFKLSFYKEPSYYVDYKNKSVKCYLTCIVKTPDFQYGNKILENTRISANGYSKCDGHDVFDEYTGKKIALARAEQKVYIKALHMINAAMNDVQKFADAYSKFGKKCWDVCAHNEGYIDQFCSATNEHYGERVLNSIQDNTEKKHCKNVQPRDEHGRFMPFCDVNTKGEDSKTAVNVFEKKNDKKPVGVRITINRH